MKTSKLLTFLCSTIFCFSLALTGCNNKSCQPCDCSNTSGNGGQEQQVWTVTFDSQGGSPVVSQQVNDGECVTKPTDPAREGFTFRNWFTEAACENEYNFELKVNNNLTLYAGWDSNTTPTPHGPEGSQKAPYYLLGEGSLWPNGDGWVPVNGIYMYSNPAGSDKACILDLTLQAGDLFKINYIPGDGTETWYGYEVITNGGGAPQGCFSGANDNFGGNNIKCDVSGTYNMYFNADGQLWIQKSN